MGGVMAGTILIVEDDEDIQNYYSFLLAGLDLNILRALSGEAALKVVESNGSVDLILLDVVLPGMGGDEFYRLLRDELKSRIPVIVCSVDDRMLQRVQEVGPVQGVFTKGTRGDDLRRMIVESLGGE
jgi:CheY-like chemotaxis protein